jgi:DNA-binding MarR family transcriptional regulator
MSQTLAVEIAACLEAEGMIRRVRRTRDRVVVELVLADGTRAAARLAPDEADWLELRAGDIAGVRPVSG